MGEPYCLDIEIWKNYAPIPNSVICITMAAIIGISARLVFLRTRGFLRSHLLVFCICLLSQFGARWITQFAFPTPKLSLPVTDELETNDTTILANESAINCEGNPDVQLFVRYSLPVLVFFTKLISLFVFAGHLFYRAEHQLVHPKKNVLLEIPFWTLALCFLVFGIFKVDPSLPSLLFLAVFCVFVSLIIAISWIANVHYKQKANPTQLEKYAYQTVFNREVALFALQGTAMVYVPVHEQLWTYHSAIYEMANLFMPICETLFILKTVSMFKSSDFKLDASPTIPNTAAGPPELAGTINSSNCSVAGSEHAGSISSAGSERDFDEAEADTEPCQHSVTGFESRADGPSIESSPLLPRSALKRRYSSDGTYTVEVKCEVHEPVENEAGQTRKDPLMQISCYSEKSTQLASPRCESTLPVGCYIEGSQIPTTSEVEENIVALGHVEIDEEALERPPSLASSLNSIHGISCLVEELKPSTNKDVVAISSSGEGSSESDQEVEKIDKRDAKEQDRSSLDSFVYYD